MFKSSNNNNIYKSILLAIIAIEIISLIVIGFNFLKSRKEDRNVEPANGEAVGEIKNDLLLTYPNLDKGFYCIEISYNSELDQNITIPNDKSVDAPRNVIISRNLESERYYIEIEHQIDSLELTIKYNGGDFNITYLNLYRSSLEYIKQAITIIAITSFLEFCVIFASKDKNNLSLLVILIGIVFSH